MSLETSTPPIEILPGADVNWEQILDAIQSEKCILCVGSGLFTEVLGERYEEQLAKHLKKEQQRLHIRVYDDGWFHYKDKRFVTNTTFHLKSFYRKPLPEVERLLQKIACLPVHCILYFLPDLKMFEAFKAQSFLATQGTYVKGESAKEINPPTGKCPIVYNMLGNMDDPNSLVMTYDDLYHYLQSVYESVSMPKNLKEVISKAEYFILLGIPFDKWYTHLFMRVLRKFESESAPPAKSAPNKGFLNDEQITTDCTDQYQITFVPKEIKAFVDELYVQCLEHPEVSLRAAHEKTLLHIPYEVLQKNLMEGEDMGRILDLLLPKLEVLGEDDPHLFDGIALRRRISEFDREVDTGRLDSDKATAESNRLFGALLSYFNRLKKDFPMKTDQ